MGFDIVEYAGAMEEFVMRMGNASADMHAGLQEEMGRICRLLRIGSVQVILYQTEKEELSGMGDIAVFYHCGTALDDKRTITKRVVTGADTIALYMIFQKEGDEDWSSTEREKIDFFIQMLFVFNSRANITKRVEYLTFHDGDFGNYNVAYFMKTVGMYIASHQIGRYAVCYFNFKRLSAINQLVGRERGTLLMIDFIKGLEQKLSAGEFVARIGGDNFIVLFTKGKLDEVKEYLTGQELVFDSKTGESVFMSVTGGFYMIPEHVKIAPEIMDKVSVAVNVARNVKRKQFVFYDEVLMLHMKSKKIIETMFPRALENEEFVVYYQPKVSLKQYELAGAEALCRWVHQGKLMPPDDFIPVLEQSNAICALDFYMLEHVCKDIRRWLDEGKHVVRVSVNLSRCHMGNPGLLQRIVSIIDAYRVPHQYIEIELTETTTDAAFNDLKGIVFGLSEQGIRTAVDDFGVGYSSLNLIKELPWSIIKVDRSFLEQREGQRGNYVMLKHVIAMAQELGMEVIVEGVETVEHVKLLKGNNCYLAQGFYFDRPLPENEFLKRISAL